MSSIYEASLNDCPLMEARKRQEVGEDQVIAECHRNNQNPSEGYDSIILTRKEVDELYRLMSIVIAVLDDLQTQYVIIKGSLLGATRSESILFNDNDIDIGIIDDGQDSHGRFHENLIQALDVSSARHRFVNGKEVTYHHARRSKEGCIRIHSSETSRAWVDIFVLKRYDSREQLMRLFDTEENAQTEDSSLYRVNYFLFESFPLYHYDDRNSIALWPNQHFSPSELFPLQHLKFGPLDVVAPRETVQTLQRFYGDDCFTHYSLVKIMSGHADHSKVDRMTAEKLPLLEEHYQPIEHSDMWSAKSRMSQQSLVDGFDCEPELEACSDEDGDEPPPRSSSPPIGMGMGMLRSKSLFVLGANSLHRSPSPSALSASLTIIYDADCMPREPGPSKWFGADLRQCTGSCSDAPEFEKTLRKAMEPHLQTARRNREMSRSPTTLQIDAPIASYIGVPYTSMREERRFLFDEHSYPIHEVLAQTLGIDDLSKLHEHPNQDMGQLLAPLLSRQHRRQFHSCFDNLVTSFCIPLLHSMAMEKRIFHNKSTKTPSKVTYRYQAFPCIRVVRPGEFSIAPHCDTGEQFSVLRNLIM